VLLHPAGAARALGTRAVADRAGLNNFARITAGAFGTSITTTLWESRASLHHARLAEHIAPGNPATRDALGALGGGGLDPGQAYALLDRMVTQQAFTLAALDLFYASAVILVLLIPFVWLARPVRGGGAAAAGAH
jgi:MFS transporter, DHA2 family, multidrug resistance protein